MGRNKKVKRYFHTTTRRMWTRVDENIQQEEEGIKFSYGRNSAFPMKPNKLTENAIHFYTRFTRHTGKQFETIVWSIRLMNTFVMFYAKSFDDSVIVVKVISESVFFFVTSLFNINYIGVKLKLELMEIYKTNVCVIASYFVNKGQDAHRAKDQRRLRTNKRRILGRYPGAGCSSCEGSTKTPVNRHCNRARGNGWSIDVDLAYVQPIMDQPGSSSRGPTPSFTTRTSVLEPSQNFLSSE
ncbi:LOW QUALITY PROTEIN: hypothetical protein V1477_019723 [Vespula maculifrons]|uniref:Uncharacterized protein n=1 Tax=Vespula maculifrons TaxID=7453 RepID=A0ABD2AR85_VESMC